MIKNDFKSHYKILSLIETAEFSLNLITERELRSKFKDYEYYQLINFCKEYKLILIKYHNVELTSLGRKYINFLKNYEKIFKEE
jgi:hypothetical protein